MSSIAKRRADKLLQLVKHWLNIDLSPHLDIKNSNQRYATIDMTSFSELQQSAVKRMQYELEGRFTIQSNGGLGWAFMYGPSIIEATQEARPLKKALKALTETITLINV